MRDNGAGIAPEMLPRLFEMFSRGDDAGRSAPGGLGIGLALSRQLAEMHGGSILAQSSGPGCGSEFTLRLPLSSGPTQSESTAPSLPLQRGLRLLVVDDNVDAAAFLAALLEILGADAKAAHSGAAALEAYDSQKPEIVLLDIGMPDMDG